MQITVWWHINQQDTQEHLTRRRWRTQAPHLIAGRADVDTLSILIARLEHVVVDSAVRDDVARDEGVHHGVLQANALAPEKKQKQQYSKGGSKREREVIFRPFFFVSSLSSAKKAKHAVHRVCVCFSIIIGRSVQCFHNQSASIGGHLLTRKRCLHRSELFVRCSSSATRPRPTLACQGT